MRALTTHKWLRVEDSVPFTVTAHVPAGFAADTPWTPSIDGILCSAVLLEALGEDYFLKENVENSPWAPLARVFEGGEGGMWWFAASSPMYTPLSQVQRRWFRRFDSAECERLVPSVNKVSLKTGPYKPFMKAQQVHMAPEVRWLCWGDPAETLRLLTDFIPTIGKRFHAGFGQVAAWEIREGHHPGGTVPWSRLQRPVPVAFAKRTGIRGRTMKHGVRPPGWLATNQVLCVMPEPQVYDPWFWEGPTERPFDDSGNRALLSAKPWHPVGTVFEAIREMPLVRGGTVPATTEQEHRDRRKFDEDMFIFAGGAKP